ncbi:MAG: FtsX-like permease family protein [Gammaproteobacteria bacterium]|nr:FtsX-like permease family protein [Gammaproteobacteria bacterium]
MGAVSGMLLLLRSQLRFLARNPVGTAVTGLGIALAVASVVTVHLTGQTLADSVRDTQALAGYSHVATRANLTEERYFKLRARWRNGEWPELAGLLPVVEGTVRLGGEFRRLVGIEPLADIGHSDRALGTSTNGAPAPMPVALQRFLIEDVLATSERVVQAALAHGDTPPDTSLVALADGDVLLADLPTAWRLLERPGQLDAVWLRTEAPPTGVRLPMQWLEALLPGLSAALDPPPGPRIDGFVVTPAANWQGVGRYADAVVFNLGALGALALLVAGFLAAELGIANVARREREMQRLLALGVSRRVLAALHFGESAVVGTMAAGIGLVAGVLLSAELSAPLSPLQPTLGEGTVDAWVIGKAFGTGVLVAMFAALAAVRRIGVRAAPARPMRRWLSASGAAIALAASAALLAGGSLLAAFAALLTLCIAHMLTVLPVTVFAVGPRSFSPKRTSLRLSLRAAGANAGEIGFALGALSVATAAAIGMGVMVESLRRDFLTMLDQRLQSGIYVAGVPEDADLSWLHERGLDVRRPGAMRARTDRGAVDVTFARIDAEEAQRYGLGIGLSERVMVNELGARRLGVAAGDTLRLGAGGHTRPVEIAHVFRDFGAPTPRVIAPETLATVFQGVSIGRDRLFVRTSGGEAVAIASEVRERWPGSRVQDQGQLRVLAEDVFDASFAVATGLAVLALVVAAVGLYGVLTALQTRRGPEFRLLHAMGMPRPTMWRMALTQCAVLGAVATVAAIPLGYATAWVLCAFVSPAAFGWTIDLYPDLGATLAPLAWGMLAALAAGALPSWRSAFRSPAPADE